MSACGRRQAGISQQTQSLLAIVAPPLLMKPSLTNADECRLVNTERSDKVEGGGGPCFYPAPFFSSASSAAFEDDERSRINPVCCVLQQGRRGLGGGVGGRGRKKKKSCRGVTVKLLERLLCVPQSPLFLSWHGTPSSALSPPLFVPSYKKIWG